MKKSTIIIVHPFTSDKFLYKTIKTRGYKIITVITNLDYKWIQQCMESINTYSDFIVHAAYNIDTDINELEKLINNNNLELKGIINGFDYSLDYRDQIANYFLQTNIDIKFSKIRCNKYAVSHELSKLPSIPTIKSLLVENIPKWHEKLAILNSFKFPVIIKPATNSAARNNMALVHNINEAKKHLDTLFTQVSTFTDQAISSYIIQEFIEGEEFIVNSTALGSRHLITGVFKYQKTGTRYNGLVSITPNDDEEQIESLIYYHNQCLGHLKFSYGIVHAEYIIDKSGQPYLIEINNRLSGVEIPFLSKECYHTDEVNIFLDLIENKANIHEFNPKKIYNYAALPYFSNYVNPHAARLDLSKLNSKYEMIVFRSGVVHAANRDNGEVFDKVSAAMWLLNKDHHSLENDLRHLRDLENDGKLFI